MKTVGLMLCLLVTGILSAQETPQKKAKETEKETSTELKEVTVYGNKKQYLKVESDKTTINVRDNAMLNSGSSLEAVKIFRRDYLTYRKYYPKQ